MFFAKLVRWSIVAIIFIGVGLYIARASLQKSVSQTLLANAVSGFTDETAQTRFMSYATTVSPLKRIELAKLNQLEMFERTSQMRVFWSKVNLPDVIVRATVPVEYVYFVEINDAWKVKLQGDVLNIEVPELAAGSPSPDISRLKFEVRKGSLLRNEKKVARDLQAEITSLLNARAKQSAPLARDTARKQIALLASQWLTSENKHASIHVRFADEGANILN